MNTQRMILVALGLALLAPVAFGATRTSANYLLATETTDAGGQRTASAGYVHDGSLGGIGGISTVAAPAEVAKHGYIGQLYDPASVRLSMSNTNVNEATTANVFARGVFDDATLLPLAGTAVAWSTVSGPISGINANGLLTTSLVYQDTPATVRGIWQGKTGLQNLQVINNNTDNYGIYGGDGIDDAWQVQYFGVSNPNALGGVDYDLDGQTNGFEYVAGTIPTNSASKFRLRIENVSGQPNWKAVIFSPRWASRSYTTLFRSDVASGTFNPLPSSTTNDVSTERTVTDLTATNAARFYRVQITWP